MKPDSEPAALQNISDSEIINRVSLKISHLFSMKEKERIVIGEFLNSEVISFNSLSHIVQKYDLTYQLGIIGDFGGNILLNLNHSLAEKIARTLFGGEEIQPEDVHTAMQELLNIFSGHLATAFNELGMDFDITTPEITEHDFVNKPAGRRILFRFLCNGEILQFVLILRPAEEKAA